MADIIAGYHNHFEGLMGDFSPEDKDWAYAYQMHLYMTGYGQHDKGHKRFSPYRKPRDGTIHSLHKPNLPDDQDLQVTKLKNETSGKKCP